jgi:hypothetical protein
MPSFTHITTKPSPSPGPRKKSANVKRPPHHSALIPGTRGSREYYNGVITFGLRAESARSRR